MKKTRVVAYSRVSTDHDDQMNSLHNQKQHWEEYIKSNPEWEYAGMYWDEGITGTSVRKRDGFNRMIADAKSGKFDLIITKSVQRWARNTVDSIQFCRKLKKIGVAVYFSSDNIHTINDSDAELRLSIMSTLAQEDSRRLSENVKFGHLRSMKNGVVYGADRLLGYDRKNKKLHINQEEAEVIKKIFYWFVFENESLHGVVRRLKEELNFTKGKMGGKIDHSAIKRIIENEKYCGDLKQRKYYTEDFLEQKQTQNQGEVEYIIIENNHEPIIERSVWDKAQKILHNRRAKSNRGVGYTRHCWGGKITCGICGDKFRRKVYKNKDGTDRPAWICTTAYDKGKKGCENPGYIREDVLEKSFNEVIEKLKEKHHQEKLFNDLNNILMEASDNQNHEGEIQKINSKISKVIAKREKLLELYMDSNLSKDDFGNKNLLLNNEEESLKLQLNSLMTMASETKNKIDNIKDFYSIIVEKYDNLTEIDKIVDNYVIEVTKYKDRLVYELFIGENIEVAMSKYPKRVNSGEYLPIMDIKCMYKVNRGAVQYYEEIDVEVLLVA